MVSRGAGPASSRAERAACRTTSRTRRPCAFTLILGIATPILGIAFSGAAAAQSRGELLYSTHCIACHNTELHWRDQRQATDWPSLQAQVRRWQNAGRLRWAEEDIVEVTRYLNEAFYRFPEPPSVPGPKARRDDGATDPSPAG